MVFSFSESNIERTASVLGVSPAWEDDLARFELSDEESGRQLALEIQTHLIREAALRAGDEQRGPLDDGRYFDNLG